MYGMIGTLVVLRHWMKETSGVYKERVYTPGRWWPTGTRSGAEKGAGTGTRAGPTHSSEQTKLLDHLRTHAPPCVARSNETLRNNRYS